MCVCVSVHTCASVCGPIISTNSVAFANIHHLSTTLFARQQCLDFAPRHFSSLFALQQGYVQGVHPYRTLLPTCVCPFPLAGAPMGKPALALGDRETDVTLLCCMRVGVRLCAETRLFPPTKEKTLAAACPPLRDSNPRSMAWLSSVFPVCYYPMWLETYLHNHQCKSFWVVPMLHFISVQCHGGSAGATQRRAGCPRFRLKKCGVGSHAFQVCSSLYAWLTGIIVSSLALAPPPL